jgi:UDP-N-acetylmuramoyl-tripeptide--D-alanyl-D-alanine ligase
MKKILALVLAFLAKKIISKYKPKVIGVTGSFGKSSAKEAIFHVLSDGGEKVRRNRGNFNNELGFPLAVIGDFDHLGGIFFYLGAVLKGLRVWLSKSDYPKILILEYGADKPGDIKYLTELARPDIAVVTGISDIPVHVEFYPSPEAVAEEKSNLVKALPESGVAILNADDALVSAMAEKTAAGTLFYGFSPEADFRVSQFSNRHSDGVPLGIAFKLETVGKSVPVIIDGVLGKGTAYAAAAASACGSLFGVPLVKAAGEMSSLETLPGRARIIEGERGAWLIDDTYNSSPAALREALISLKSIPAKRKIAVLGGMMELGSLSDAAHRELGVAAAGSADVVVGIGEKGKELIAAAAEAGKKTAWFDNSAEASEGVEKMVREGDVILVKGSQSVRTEKVVKALMKNPEKAGILLVRQYGNWLKN